MLAAILLTMLVAGQAAGAYGRPAQEASSQSESAKAQDQVTTSSTARAKSATVECANPGAAQTQAVTGPRGVAAVLRVETADDHSKDSHDCMADYELEIANGGDGRTADFLSSDDEYGRRITVRLDGFSQDGKRVIGILSEAGKDATTVLFDYHIDGGEARLVDLSKMFLPTITGQCSEGFEAVGTTADGVIVVELAESKECGAGGRWAVDPDGSEPKKISGHAKVIPFYGAKTDEP
jgi:hypothetical protein